MDLLTALRARLNRFDAPDELMQRVQLSNQLFEDLRLPIRVIPTRQGVRIDVGYTREIYEPQLRELAVLVEEM